MTAGTPSGKLAANIMHFVRVLRGAGLPVGPASVVDAIDAAQSGSLRTREEFYWTLHCILVKRREHTEVFDQAFHVFWKKPKMLEQLMQLMFPQIARSGPEKPRAPGFRRLAETMFNQDNGGNQRQTKDVLEMDATFTTSADEILRTKDFDQMTRQEQSQTKAMITRLRLRRRTYLSRRFKSDLTGTHLDMRRTLRQSLQAGSHFVGLAWRKRRDRERPLVVLCDISGSCSNYSRMFLHFLHGLANSRTNVTVFLFGTRLTNITREITHRDIDESLAKVSSAVKDWSGGTRIGATLKEFNFKWSRRVLAHGAEVLLMTDGLERDDATQLLLEIQRLRRSTKRIVWLNPLLRFGEFKAKASGIRTILPYVDEFRPIHNFNAVADLAETLGRPSNPDHDPRTWMKTG